MNHVHKVIKKSFLQIDLREADLETLSKNALKLNQFFSGCHGKVTLAVSLSKNS